MQDLKRHSCPEQGNLILRELGTALLAVTTELDPLELKWAAASGPDVGTAGGLEGAAAGRLDIGTAGGLEGAAAGRLDIGTAGGLGHKRAGNTRHRTDNEKARLIIFNSIVQ